MLNSFQENGLRVAVKGNARFAYFGIDNEDFLLYPLPKDVKCVLFTQFNHV